MPLPKSRRVGRFWQCQSVASWMLSFLPVGVLDAAPLGGFLDRIGATYPNWDVPSQIEELTAIWHRYTALSGVQFVSRDHGPDEMVHVW